MKTNYYRYIKNVCITALFLIAFSGLSIAQKKQAKANVAVAKYYDKSFPLRDITPIPPDGNHRMWKGGLVPNNFKRKRFYNSKNAFPKNGDPIVQKAAYKHNEANTILNFEGISLSDNSATFAPPDTDGDIGQDYYFQMINVMFEIFDRSGNSVYGPADNKTLWEGFAGEWTGTNDGDPIVLYDENANRWIATQFALPNYPNPPFYELIAISETADPLGAWYRYAFEFSAMPDYPKFGIWNDGYYMTLNSSGDNAVVFERDSLIIGSQEARMVAFKIPDFPGQPNTFSAPLPACSQGQLPPAGTPNYIMYFNDDGWGFGEDKIMIWEFDVDWENVSNSTLTLTQNLPVEPFDSEFNQYWNDIAQPGTSQKLDAIPGAMMFSLQYRNFGSHQTMVANHTVDVDATNHAGVRWYELRNANNGGGWEIYQQSTFAPDDDSRFMGSMAIDGSGNIALGYSVSSENTYPSIRFTGRLATDPLNQMTFNETDMHIGEYSQTSGNRWGDYSMMSIDPTDDATFWYTQEFMKENNKWATRIASFQLQIPTTSFISFKLTDQFGFTAFDADAEEIYVVIDYEADPSSQIATFTLPEGSTVQINGTIQESGVTVNDFTNPVVYTITDAESVSKDWKVIVTEQIPENDIITYSIPNETKAAIINDDDYSVNVEMPYNSDVTALVAAFSLSPGAGATVNGFTQVSNTTVNDFTETVTYLVTALDASTQEWDVIVSEASGLCEAASQSCDEFISQVEIGDINNPSACEGYSDFSYLSTDVAKGEGYEITVTNGNPYSDDECGIWVDWNNNRDFSDDEPVTVSGSPGNGPYTATIIPPLNAVEGKVYMRVRIVYNETPQPCGPSSYGEVEDYTLFVTPANADFFEFGFEASTNSVLDEDVMGTVADSTISVILPPNVDRSDLVATFTIPNGATTTINSIAQESGVTSNDFTGEVVYIVTTENNQDTKSWKVIVENEVSVSSNLDMDIEIYPNPATSKLFIKLGNVTNTTSISILNVTGQTVHTEILENSISQINISDLKNGLYFIKIQNNGNAFITKLIKK